MQCYSLRNVNFVALSKEKPHHSVTRQHTKLKVQVKQVLVELIDGGPYRFVSSRGKNQVIPDKLLPETQFLVLHQQDNIFSNAKSMIREIFRPTLFRFFGARLFFFRYVSVSFSFFVVTRRPWDIWVFWERNVAFPSQELECVVREVFDGREQIFVIQRCDSRFCCVLEDKVGGSREKVRRNQPRKTSAKLKSLTSLRNPVHSLTASGAT